mmetsp:Transcript_9960/g.23355  ORF Transcript_9960/g.23355 Transcript_9960/m.23355 type:complete len:251 (-) Transcript_9960:1752-2504(-)
MVCPGHPREVQVLHEVLPVCLAPPVETAVFSSHPEVRPVLVPHVLREPLLDEPLLLRGKEKHRVALVLGEGLDDVDEVLIGARGRGAPLPEPSRIHHRVAHQRVRGVGAAVVEKDHPARAPLVLLHHVWDVEVRVHAVLRLEPEEAGVGPEPEAGRLLPPVFLPSGPDVGQDRLRPLVDVVVRHELVQPLQPHLEIDFREVEGLFDPVDDAVHVPGVHRERPREHPRASEELRDAEGCHLLLAAHDEFER